MLHEHEARRLFEAADFLPSGIVMPLLDPDVRAAAEVLTDESIPASYRESLRLEISALVGITRQMAA